MMGQATFPNEGPPIPPRKNKDTEKDGYIGAGMMVAGLAGVAIMRTTGVPDYVDLNSLALVVLIWFAVSILAIKFKL